MKGGITRPSEIVLNKLQQDVMKQYNIINLDNRKEAPLVAEDFTTRTRR